MQYLGLLSQLRHHFSLKYAAKMALTKENICILHVWFYPIYHVTPHPTPPDGIILRAADQSLLLSTALNAEILYS
jgi:hypothetical protein